MTTNNSNSKDRAKQVMPKGFRLKQGELQVAIRFQEVMFERVKQRALQENKTFSEMVVELCGIGLFDLEESDSHEQAA
jgi:hypothetical protein